MTKFYCRIFITKFDQTIPKNQGPTNFFEQMINPKLNLYVLSKGKRFNFVRIKRKSCLFMGPRKDLGYSWFIRIKSIPPRWMCLFIFCDYFIQLPSWFYTFSIWDNYELLLQHYGELILIDVLTAFDYRQSWYLWNPDFRSFTTILKHFCKFSLCFEEI